MSDQTQQSDRTEQVQQAEAADHDPRPYTVVVGVSATSKSPTALVWGAAQAAQNNGRLVAVRSWRPSTPPATTSGGVGTRVTDKPSTERSEQAALEADVAAVLGDDHGAEIRAVRGGKRKVLLAAAEDADLLVVDAPRTFTGTPLFAQRIVYAASCPVVVMPPRVSQEPPTVIERAGRAVGRAAVRSAGLAGRPGYRPPMARD
ncbi:universal stress protein family protein [Knoellia remsis]|uniref:Universal stress protein family protein n=1 Tax=Knoellia remsis TaxID=407159 RepID=A0A2T0UGN7_9MICO|nr:universal stress protein [Knoellia remsis]PRY57111.1 universal stress protein family protein [Knoellia remsis]